MMALFWQSTEHSGSLNQGVSWPAEQQSTIGGDSVPMSSLLVSYFAWNERI
jgi:hypothetical protein